MTFRDFILTEIREERMLQPWSAEHDDTLSACQWVAILSRCVGLAINDGALIDLPRFRRQMIRCAAAALAAVEAFDRASPPERAVGLPPEQRSIHT